MPTINEARPPYVRFEIKAVEDRSKSETNGHYATKDVVFAYITPQGSRDTVERIAEEWLAQRAQDAREGRFPENWLAGYRQMFANFKAGIETPLDGTPVKNWPVASPSQVVDLVRLRLLTVEDVAVANDEVLQSLGPGGLHLRTKAKEWLSQSKGIGRTVEEMSNLRLTVDRLSKQVEDMQKIRVQQEAELTQLRAAAGVAGATTMVDDPEGSITLTNADLLGK